MNITYVRGAFLNPFELQLYAPLASRHEVSAIGADWQFYSHPILFPQIRIRHPSLSGTFLASLNSSSPIFINRLLSWTTGSSYGLRHLKREILKADILHPAETFFTMTYQCLELKRRLGCKLVVTVSENLPHMGETHPRRRRRKEAVIREADAFIAITPTTQKMLIEEGVPPGKIRVIPNSIDTARFQPTARNAEWVARLGLKSDEQMVLFIGRFIEEKGIRDILQAIPVVRQAMHPKKVRFCFVGAGPLLPVLQTAQKTLGAGISIVPFVPYFQVHHLHNLADIFILPSKTSQKVAEQFGYVLAESMACGKPIITTSVGSIPDVVGDAAIVIPPGNPVQLAREIIGLLESPERCRVRYGRQALDREAQSIYSAERNSRKIEQLYEEVLSLDRPRPV